MNIKLAPSILSADFAHLGAAVAQAEAAGADWIHVDVMDGHFVPNITIGPPVTAALRKVTDLPLDVHLMIEEPDRFLEAFADAGASILTVHFEACVHLHRTVDRIRQLGVKAGVAINPATPVALLQEIVPFVDLILVMSVNPGFGGQSYIETSAGKIAAVRRLLGKRADSVEIEVDGGISQATAAGVVRAGATVLVAGAAVFSGKGTVEENIRALRDAADSFEE